MTLQRRWILLTCLLWLLTAGCRPSAPPTTLHAAVQDGNYQAVRQHIAARSDLNTKDQSGWTALHLAATKGDLPMVRLLTEAGADTGRTGPGDKTPLDVARAKGRTSVVQYLETKLNTATEKTVPPKRGRGLIDGGLGVSEALDAQ